MNRPDGFAPPFQVNGWMVQPDLNRIEGPQGSVQIEPRVMQVLLVLALRPGQVISRNTILDEVWGDQIVGEENLTRAISELRRVFGDQARTPQFIETIRNHGYRLIAEIQAVPEDGESAVVREKAGLADQRPPGSGMVAGYESGQEAELSDRGPQRHRWVFIPLVAVVLGFLAVMLGPRLNIRAPEADRIEDLHLADPVPLTTYPGRERHPAFSPDGTRVAFVWSGPEPTGSGGSTFLFIKQRNAETPLQLTREPGWVAWPAWSADGQTLAYVQGSRGEVRLCTISSLGGPPRTIHNSSGLIEGVDWLPGDLGLVFSAPGSAGMPHTLLTLDLSSLEVRPVAGLTDASGGSFMPRMAPAGDRLAWIGSDRGGRNVVMWSDWPVRKVRVLARGLGRLGGLSWSPDGTRLVFGAAPGGEYSLWTVKVGKGNPRPLELSGGMAWNPRIARDSGDLVFEQLVTDRDIWQVRVRGTSPLRLESKPFAPSTRWEFEADFHPDGSRVALVSTRSGHPEIWVADSTGVDLARLTDRKLDALTHPRWSTVGTRIACNVLRDGRSEVLVLDARGGKPMVLPDEGLRQEFCSWAPDDRGLLVSRETPDGWRLFLLTMVGFLDPEHIRAHPLAEVGAVNGVLTSDGRHLYINRPGQPGLWRLEADESGDFFPGDPELVISQMSWQDHDKWRLHDGRVVWVMRVSGLAYLVMTDLGDGTETLVTDLPSLAGPGLAVSPSGGTFLYSHGGKMEADLILIPGFSP